MSKTYRRILVFGYFGYKTNQLDGQTVKTRAVYDLIKERMPDSTVNFADSQEFRHSPLSILRFLIDLMRCDILIWLPAHNNLRFLFPPLWYASKLFRFRIIYVVVGGWLSTLLKTLPFHRRKLGQLKAILVENQTTVAELAGSYSYINVNVFPNFRAEAPEPIVRQTDGKLRLVFMARINMLKGLDTIVSLCETMPQGVSIDFYGPMNPEDEPFFRNELIDKYPFVAYHGTLQPAEIHTTLQRYDAMILPTRYFTEGFPGSILDAYRASLPVIVTEWKHAREFVSDGVTGFIADFNNPIPQLQLAIRTLLDNPATLLSMKKAALGESRKYTPDSAWEILRHLL